jgi:tRNA pseudouridine(38-40) synthase
MPHWKTILTYDGTPYNGWQIQPSLPTVQGTLARAIHQVTGETVLPQGSGRTDTGVHAVGQVATFSLSVPIPAQNLHRALNRALPPSIRILAVEAVSEDFHARHSARRKTYEYRILPACDDKDRVCPPMLAPYVWACRLPLELAPLQQAAAHILGTHDFTSFAATDPDLTTRLKSQLDVGPSRESHRDVPPRGKSQFNVGPPNESQLNVPPPNELSEDGAAEIRKSRRSKDTVISTEGGASPAAVESPPHLLSASGNASNPITDNTRTIFHSAWHQQGDLLIYRITGSGFLHHMVRNLVGTYVEVAANHPHPDAIPKILAARNRAAAGPTAPARGLSLVEVIYTDAGIMSTEAEAKS